MRRALLGLVVVLALAGGAGAHGRSVSHSRWTIEPTGARVELRLAQRDLAVRGIADAGGYATRRLQLLAGSEPCAASAPAVRPSAEGWLTLAWTLTCAAAPDRVENRLFLDGPGARLHFMRLRDPGGNVVERIFGPSDVTLVAGAPSDAASPSVSHTIGRYVWLGVEHILSGWDHLAFLAGLLVLAARLRDVLMLATGFTVAHSVTLAISVLGIARPDQAAVEALIGFSIVLIAAENVWLVTGRGTAIPRAAVAGALLLVGVAAAGWGAVSPLTMAGVTVFTAAHFALLTRAGRAERLRVAIAFGFGLIHGFGFAGILHEAALPPEALVPALLGFNVGVELGQLGAIVVAWPFLALLAREPVRARLTTEAVSSVLAGLGTFWFVSRTFG